MISASCLVVHEAKVFKHEGHAVLYRVGRSTCATLRLRRLQTCLPAAEGGGHARCDARLDGALRRDQLVERNVPPRAVDLEWLGGGAGWQHRSRPEIRALIRSRVRSLLLSHCVGRVTIHAQARRRGSGGVGLLPDGSGLIQKGPVHGTTGRGAFSAGGLFEQAPNRPRRGGGPSRPPRRGGRQLPGGWQAGQRRLERRQAAGTFR